MKRYRCRQNIVCTTKVMTGQTTITIIKIRLINFKEETIEMSSEIRDINLAESGEKKIEWVKRNCDLLRTLEKEFSESKPFAGKKIALSVHLEAKTAYLCLVLAAGGAEMYVTGSNPLSTQDDVAAALVKAGLEVHSWYGTTPEEYETHIRHVLEAEPNIIIDDGGDLVTMVHKEMPQLIPNIIGV